MARVSWWLGNTFLGFSERGEYRNNHFDKVKPPNYALCCPTCGEVWARVVDESAEHWSFCHRPCPQHGPGLVSIVWDHSLDDMPREVLQRELEIYFQYYPSGEGYFDVLTWKLSK